MRGYSEHCVFKPDQLEDFRAAERIVARLPEKVDGEWVRCHELARAVGTLLGNRWHVVDGKLRAVEHTWLVWRGRGRVILDVYAPGVLPQVQLVDLNPLWARDGLGYVAGEHRRDLREDVIQLLRRLGDPAHVPSLGRAPAPSPEG